MELQPKTEKYISTVDSVSTTGPRERHKMSVNTVSEAAKLNSYMERKESVYYKKTYVFVRVENQTNDLNNNVIIERGALSGAIWLPWCILHLRGSYVGLIRCNWNTTWHVIKHNCHLLRFALDSISHIPRQTLNAKVI